MVKESDFKVFAESFLEMIKNMWTDIDQHIYLSSRHSPLCKSIYDFLTKNDLINENLFSKPEFKDLEKYYDEKIDLFANTIRKSDFVALIQDTWCRVYIGNYSEEKVQFKDSEFKITNKEYFSINKNIYSWQGIDEFFVALENIIFSLNDFCKKENFGLVLKFPSNLKDMLSLGDSIVIHYHSVDEKKFRNIIDNKLKIYDLLKPRKYRQKSGFDIGVPENWIYRNFTITHTEAIAMVIIFDFFRSFVENKSELSLSQKDFIIWFKAELKSLNSLKIDNFMERFSQFAS